MDNSSSTEQVLIREVGPREGFQSLPVAYPTEKKLELIDLLINSGLKHIEVTSMVRADRVPHMADAEELIARLPELEGVEFSALYLNQKGFQRAEATGRLSNQGWLYSSPSESFLKANSNLSIQESISSVAAWVECFASAGKRVHGLMISTAFGCEMEGSMPAPVVGRLVEQFLTECASRGEHIHEVCLADTVGHANPLAVREAVKIVSAFGVAVSLHLHDTRGLGLCNSYAGLEAGVSIFETSIGGMGGCPFTPGSAGNVATEDMVYLCESLGLSTGLDISRLCEAAEFAEVLTGTPLSGHVYKTRR